MTYSDKSYKTGHDELDREIMEAYERLKKEVPIHQMRRIEHRIHDGIFQQMKANSAKVCSRMKDEFATCVNATSILQWNQCRTTHDALNECYRAQNSEENYQRIRLQFLNGELHELHKQRLTAKVELYKTMLPGVPLPEAKSEIYAKTHDSDSNIGNIYTNEHDIPET